MSENWDIGTSETLWCEEDCLCLTDFMPIHIPAMRTKGMPIPSPTPRPSLMIPVLELALEEDDATVPELLWEACSKLNLRSCWLSRKSML